MHNPLVLKLLSLFVVGSLLLYAIHTVDQLAGARAQRREEALAGIARSVSGAQTVQGPLLVIPYVVTGDERPRQRHVVILPKRLEVDAEIETEQRARGLFSGSVLHSTHVLKGEVELPREFLERWLSSSGTVQWGKPRLVLGVTDARGIRMAPEVRWAGQGLSAEPGTGGLGAGFQALVPDLSSLPNHSASFEVKLRLDATQGMSWTPSATSVEVNLRSPWPHPSFFGTSLPDTRDISEKGFSAKWRMNRFSTGAVALQDVFDSDIFSRQQGSFGVELGDPVDIYLLSERATKYGFLFLLLSFTAFFLFELLANCRIHPIQYGLVGVAQAVFFVLLLALSEHLSFSLSYWLASASCVGLMTAYAWFVLMSGWRALLFGGGLAGLYAAMKVLLSSEDHALLLGAALLFVVTATVMFLTRHLDWRNVGKSEPLISRASL